jgi:hypothetical protein
MAMMTSPRFTLDFSNLDSADRIVVTTNMNRAMATVTDASRIAEIRDVLSQLTDGWVVPVEGVPVAGLRMNIYAGDTLLGNVGFAQTFLTALNKGSFWSRSIEPEIYKQLTDLLDVGLANLMKKPRQN